MKKVLIHIGTGKTGTSSIQKALFGHQEKLKGVIYPCVRGNSQNYLSLIYQPIDRLARVHRATYKNSSDLNRNAAALKETFFSH